MANGGLPDSAGVRILSSKVGTEIAFWSLPFLVADA